MLPGASLADDDSPTVAFLRFGASRTFALADSGVLDILQAYGYISADERAQLDSGSDLRGENINLLYRDANFDYASAALMVEDALDEGADILTTISNEVGLLVGNAISEMEEPPALIFAIVTGKASPRLAIVRAALEITSRLFLAPQPVDRAREDTALREGHGEG